MNDYLQKAEELLRKLEANKEALPDSRIVLFGASMKGGFAIERLGNKYNIYAVADNNPMLWGTEFGGVRIIAPGELAKIEKVFVIITVSGECEKEIIEQLNEIGGISYLTYMEYVLLYHFDEIKEVYAMLEDDLSKNTYGAIILSYLTHDMNYLRKVFVKEQYFALPQFCVYSMKDIFVDCGAYVGDTTEAFFREHGGNLKRVYAFEPTDKLCSAIRARKERFIREWALDDDQLIIEQKAVGDREEEKAFSGKSGKAGSRLVQNMDESCEKVSMVSLDRYFEDIPDKPTFIKADIEGAELAMLNGAKDIISRCHPLLAICIYHRPEDLFEIPLFIKRLNPDYKFAVRHHAPNYWETVLYCC